ncbi:hypothetical protein D5S18_02915 [Nocardia panacis]|uniref:Uncharacterized protein n=1 Tax=Nocardia panacis TaxID=2340916 RepID=A0A3A4KEZ3_9NOCA|nr:hypothetical protein [Nocardia panacis]RJO79298.1 hypothetical protein D5S18_02915 [Nocardia panacis]
MGQSIGASEIKAISIGGAGVRRISVGTSLIWTNRQEFSDNFDRANGPLGPNWDTSGLSAYIYGNAAGRPDEKSAGVTNFYWGVWRQPLATDDIEVSAVAVSPKDGLENLLNANRYGVSVGARFKAGSSTGVVAQMWDNQASIYSYDNTGKSTERAQKTGLNIGVGSRLRLTAIDNTYTAYIGSAQVCQWVDTAGIVPTGPDYRRPVFIVVGNKNFLGNYDSVGWGIDDWAAADI